MQADLTEICNNSAMNNGYPSYHFRQRPNNSATILASSEQASPLGWVTASPTRIINTSYLHPNVLFR